MDDSGVQRDIFSAFWTEAYTHLFEGANTLIRMVQPGVDISTFRKNSLTWLPSIWISSCPHALPSLVSMLLGTSTFIPSEVMVESFTEYISEVERLKLKAALSTSLPLSSSMVEDHIDILSKFGCRQVPNCSNLSKLIEEVARYEFCVKPAAALSLIHSGIPQNHQQFWQKKGALDIHDLFYAMTVTPTKVLSLLDLNTTKNENESRVFGYLSTMMGNMEVADLSRLLRFVTGASACIVPKITVEFNGLDSSARRPIAHTCDSVLEPPVSYINYENFVSEFMLILKSANKSFAWRMDAM